MVPVSSDSLEFAEAKIPPNAPSTPLVCSSKPTQSTDTIAAIFNTLPMAEASHSATIIGRIGFAPEADKGGRC